MKKKKPLGKLVTKVHNKGMPLNMGPKTQNNDPCHCGSKLKYKKCCKAKDDARFVITVEDKEKHGIKE